jgi:hypothetical protein
MANTTYSGWGRGQYYSGPYGQPVVDSIQVTGVFATGEVGSVNIWLPIDDSQTPNWNAISDSQTPNWNAISDSQTPNWNDIAA